ncbi:MAG TPA: tetratricopeptide repeat protein [Acidimicrobiales bacterium]|nr:tetratricopeptide repeat protein [Acidimicrobiales bacterium]
MAVQDDRRVGRAREVDTPSQPSPEATVEIGVDGSLAVVGTDDGTAGEAGAQPSRRDDDLPPPRWLHDRFDASLRTLTDVLKRCYRPAERGHARALHILGKKLEDSDAAKAEDCFRWAARSGDTDAIADLGVMTAMRGDLSAAKGLLLQAARSGHARAMYNLGVLSEGVDAQRTEEWYRRSAQAGFADAMYNLGVHLEAHGAPEDAEEWYREAASSGHTHAMNNLGAALQRRRELREAELWYRRAAQAGNADAMNNLGALLERRGEVDPAARWYRRAAESGDVRGMTNLADVLDRRGETDQAEHWHRLADPDWTPRRTPLRRR